MNDFTTEKTKLISATIAEYFDDDLNNCVVTLLQVQADLGIKKENN